MTCCVCGVALIDYDEREDGICWRCAEEGYRPDPDEGAVYVPSLDRHRTDDEE